jgi:hypothetical protein
VRGLLLAAGVAGVMFMGWTVPGAVGAGALHSTAGLVVVAACGWIALCSLVIRTLAVGAAESSE